MILVDTSIWVDHLRRGDAQLAQLLESAVVVTHPFVIGEIACGSLSDRGAVLELLQDLPMAVVADADEILRFIERHRLYGFGIGYVDAQLLAATQLTADTALWTEYKHLAIAASRLGCAINPEVGTPDLP